MNGIVDVPVSTLSVTHIFDGEEVVTGSITGQVWIATFCDAGAAQNFIEYCQDNMFYIKGIFNANRRIPSPADLPVRAT